MLASSAITRSLIDRGCRGLKANFPGAARTAQDYVRRAANAEDAGILPPPGSHSLPRRERRCGVTGRNRREAIHKASRHWQDADPRLPCQPAAAQARQEAGRFIHNVRRVAWRHLFRATWGREGTGMRSGW